MTHAEVPLAVCVYEGFRPIREQRHSHLQTVGTGEGDGHS